ncbi:MAG: thiamine diphosphokinase [Chloroflexi bacterium]|nr:thiamine diphosphokinase [Chloroflexota bacterium]
MKAVVVAHGEVDPGDIAHVRGADLVIAADGGSVHLERWGIAPHLIVGDLDSIDERTRSRISRLQVERHPAEKDKTDTELAVDRALAAGADEVVLIGALGGARLDHAVANTLLLALEHVSPRVRLVRGALSMRVIHGGQRADLLGREGDLVTLVAVGGDAQGVVTAGLRYPLRSETLRLGSSRGVSNEIGAAAASVSVGAGCLLVIEDGRMSASGPEQQPKA